MRAREGTHALRIALELEGYEVETVPNGTRAMQAGADVILHKPAAQLLQQK